MLTQEKVLKWKIEFDKELTIQAYSGLRGNCDCAYCRNFLIALHDLSPEFFELLQRLGIDPTQPTEIVYYESNNDGSHLYGWWYHCVGRIIDGNDGLHHNGWLYPFVGGKIDGKGSFIEFVPGIQVGFNSKDELASKKFPRPIIQIEFIANLPWVLAENP
jgi:hypothetical protein